MRSKNKCAVFFLPFCHWLPDFIPLNTVTVLVLKGARYDNPFVCRICRRNTALHTTYLFGKKISANSNKICTDGFFHVWQMVRIPYSCHDKSLLFFSLFSLFGCYSSFQNWELKIETWKLVIKRVVSALMNQQTRLFSKIWVKWMKITPASSWNWIFCLVSSFSLAIR